MAVFDKAMKILSNLFYQKQDQNGGKIKLTVQKLEI
jgi:hypothetical protein